MRETQPDWPREAVGVFEWSPGKQLIRTVRWYQRAGEMNAVSRFVFRRLIRYAHRFWSTLAGADIPLTAQLGGGVSMPHSNGVVIHPACKVGVNCTIFQQVTLGGRDEFQGAPVIGANVLLGAGAKILGGVHVGDGAKIGANAVVLDDVPAGATAVGVPARCVVKRDDDGKQG